MGAGEDDVDAAARFVAVSASPSFVTKVAYIIAAPSATKPSITTPPPTPGVVNLTPSTATTAPSNDTTG